MPKKDNFFLQIIIAVVVNLIASAILARCSYIWKKLEWNFMWLSIIFAVIVFIQIAYFVIYAIWKRTSYRAYYYPKRKIQYDYIIKKAVVYYTLNTRKEDYKDLYELELSRDMEIIATAQELDRISDKYVWTGKVEAKIPQGTKNIRAIQKLKDQPGIWKYFEVIFHKKIGKGDSIEISYKWPTIKDCKTSSAFISTHTDKPTKELVFNINLGLKYAGKYVHLEERRSIDGDNMLSHMDYQLDDKGCVTIQLSPQRFRYFIIFWEW